MSGDKEGSGFNCPLNPVLRIACCCFRHALVPALWGTSQWSPLVCHLHVTHDFISSAVLLHILLSKHINVAIFLYCFLTRHSEVSVLSVSPYQPCPSRCLFEPDYSTVCSLFAYLKQLSIPKRVSSHFFPFCRLFWIDLILSGWV